MKERKKSIARDEHLAVKRFFLPRVRKADTRLLRTRTRAFLPVKLSRWIETPEAVVFPWTSAEKNALEENKAVRAA